MAPMQSAYGHARAFSSALLLLLLAMATAPVHVAADVILVSEIGNFSYYDRSALFGPRVNDSGVLGIVVPGVDFDNEDACLANSTLPDIPPDQPWIALVKRGQCSFADKVRAPTPPRRVRRAAVLTLGRTPLWL